MASSSSDAAAAMLADEELAWILQVGHWSFLMKIVLGFDLTEAIGLSLFFFFYAFLFAGRGGGSVHAAVSSWQK